VVNRPTANIGNRVVQNNVNNVNVNSWKQYNAVGYNNRPYYGKPGYWNQPFYGGRPASYWARPWAGYHYGWHTGYWNYFSTFPSFWTGVAAGALAAPEPTFVYSNAYYVAPPPSTTVVVQAPNYSEPIPAPTIEQTVIAYPPAPDEDQVRPGDPLPTTAPPPPAKDDAAAAAEAVFDDARTLFKSGKYADAEAKVDAAIDKLPSDATLHEFRSLTLFAQGKYKEAAAGLYAVLAAGPGWNWETMSALYGDTAEYSKQLRALEGATKTDTEGSTHFLLAYQYLVLGDKDAAVTQLKETTRLQPNDKLSAELVKALTGKGGVTPPPIPGK
jgi:Tetratricopeptide repeat